MLNPFLSEEDLLKRILQDFGVVSREDVKAGRLTGVSKQELIDTLYDFLLGLIPLKASAVLIIDEAQNLPLPVLEQIRILSNLETDKEKLLQIILVGQLNLQDAAAIARAAPARSARVDPLRAEAARRARRWRLRRASPDDRRRLGVGRRSRRRRSQQVHRLSGGIPRLINLICDRALLAGFSVRDQPHHAGDGDARGGEPRPAAADRAPRFAMARDAARVAGRGGGGRAARVARWPSASRRYLYQRCRERDSRASQARAVEADAPGPARRRRRHRPSRERRSSTAGCPLTPR